jgi:hypothetical protein
MSTDRINELADEADSDPLEDVPEEVRAAIGAYDTDTAGGCG